MYECTNERTNNECTYVLTNVLPYVLTNVRTYCKYRVPSRKNSMGTGREIEDEDGNEVEKEKEKEVVQVTVGNKGVGRGREIIITSLSFLFYVIFTSFHGRILL
jgi:hypothetical protein